MYAFCGKLWSLSCRPYPTDKV